MKTLQKYIKESLLDDINDLEQKSDYTIKKIQSIGDEYVIGSINDTYGDLFDFLDKSILKKVKNIWDHRDFRG